MLIKFAVSWRNSILLIWLAPTSRSRLWILGLAYRVGATQLALEGLVDTVSHRLEGMRITTNRMAAIARLSVAL